MKGNCAEAHVPSVIDTDTVIRPLQLAAPPYRRDSSLLMHCELWDGNGQET